MALNVLSRAAFEQGNLGGRPLPRPRKRAIVNATDFTWWHGVTLVQGAEYLIAVGDDVGATEPLIAGLESLAAVDDSINLPIALAASAALAAQHKRRLTRCRSGRRDRTKTDHEPGTLRLQAIPRTHSRYHFDKARQRGHTPTVTEATKQALTNPRTMTSGRVSHRLDEGSNVSLEVCSERPEKRTRTRTRPAPRATGGGSTVGAASARPAPAHRAIRHFVTTSKRNRLQIPSSARFPSPPQQHVQGSQPLPGWASGVAKKETAILVAGCLARRAGFSDASDLACHALGLNQHPVFLFGRRPRGGVRSGLAHVSDCCSSVTVSARTRIGSSWSGIPIGVRLNIKHPCFCLLDVRNLTLTRLIHSPFGRKATTPAKH